MGPTSRPNGPFSLGPAANSSGRRSGQCAHPAQWREVKTGLAGLWVCLGWSGAMRAGLPGAGAGVPAELRGRRSLTTTYRRYNAAFTAFATTVTRGTSARWSPRVRSRRGSRVTPGGRSADYRNIRQLKGGAAVTTPPMCHRWGSAASASPTRVPPLGSDVKGGFTGDGAARRGWGDMRTKFSLERYRQIAQQPDISPRHLHRHHHPTSPPPTPPLSAQILLKPANQPL